MEVRMIFKGDVCDGEFNWNLMSIAFFGVNSTFFGMNLLKWSQNVQIFLDKGLYSL